jgi:hypothetical protein
MEWVALGASVLTALGSFLGVFLANRKQTALIEYRLKQLESKVDKHNQVIERTYKLEERASVIEERVREIESR